MKNKYGLLVFLGLIVLFAAVSCKSAPPPEEPPVVTPVAPPAPPQEPAPDRAAMDALAAASNRAAEARKLVIDFEGPSYFPPDWVAADFLFTQAEQQKKSTTLKEAQESTARYNTAANALEALRDKTLAKYAEDREKELVAARDAVINAKGDVNAPDYVLETVNLVMDALRKYEAKDYYGAKDDAANALDMYNAQKIGNEAYNIREEIFNNGLDRYVSRELGTTDDTGLSAIDEYDAGLYGSAGDKAGTALTGYSRALKAGWEAFVSEKKVEATVERQKALDLKANVAVRQEYNATQAIYTRADNASQRGNYKESADLYLESKANFIVITELALEKQRTAEDALKRANQRIAESDETARNAEIILEGGAQ